MKWTNPPEAGIGKGRAMLYKEEAAMLVSRPGEWALVFENRSNPTAAGYISGGNLAAFQPKGSFEGVSRKNAAGNFDIYARFVGNA